MNKQMIEKLLPCPFCGLPAKVDSSFPDHKGPSCYIGCSQCDMSPEGCYRNADELELAIAAWNTRAYNPDDRLRGALSDDECAICSRSLKEHQLNGGGVGMCQIYPIFTSKRAMFDRLSALSPLPQGDG